MTTPIDFYFNNIKKEFDNYKLYKDNYDYMMGTPLVSSLLKKIEKLEKNNRRLLKIVSKEIGENKAAEENKEKRDTHSVKPLRKLRKLYQPVTQKNIPRLDLDKVEKRGISVVVDDLGSPFIDVPNSPYRKNDEDVFILEKPSLKRQTNNIIELLDTNNEITVNDDIIIKEENNILSVSVVPDVTPFGKKNEIVEADEEEEEEAEEEETEETEEADEEEEEVETEEVNAEEEDKTEEVEAEVEAETEEAEEEETEEVEVEEEEEAEVEVEEEEEETEEVEVEEEEADEEEEAEETVFSVEIEGKEYYTTDEINGVIFNEEATVEVGIFQNGIPKFYTKQT